MGQGHWVKSRQETKDELEGKLVNAKPPSQL